MKAAWHDRYGPPSVVEVREMPKPEPGPADVLVRVRAASVNRADLDGLYPRWAFTRLIFGLRRPRSPWLGIDVAGSVEAIGSEVTRFEPGDEVMADLFNWGQRTGAFAEYACAPEKAFAVIPDGMSHAEAATLPHSAVLALQALRRRDGRTIEPGNQVMIVGASGNVGPFAVQIAKARGAEVTGVASGAKLDFVRSVGADNVIDYRTTDVSRTGERYDWIVDVDAHQAVFRWRNALKPRGTYISCGGSGAWLLSSFPQTAALSHGGRFMGLLLWWKPFHGPDVENLKELISEGKLKPVIDRTFSLDQVADALKWVDEGHAQGKVIVTP